MGPIPSTRLLGLNSVGEIAAVDLETSPNGETGADSTPIERLEIPAATPISPVASEDKSFKKDPSNKTSELKLRSKSTKNDPGSDQSRQTLLPSATSSRSVTKSSSGIVAPVDQDVILAHGDSPARPDRPRQHHRTPLKQQRCLWIASQVCCHLARIPRLAQDLHRRSLQGENQPEWPMMNGQSSRARCRPSG